VDSPDDLSESCANAEMITEHFMRSPACTSDQPNLSYFFCDKPQTEGNSKLHQVTTFELDVRVRSCSYVFQDSNLIAKFSAGDMIAVEARYHSGCLISLYKQAAAAETSKLCDDDAEFDVSCKYRLAFAQLVEYMCELQSDSTTTAVFKLSELARRYQTRLEQMGVAVDGRVHTTGLKNRLLLDFPGMRAQPCGKEVLLVCDGDIGNALSIARQFDKDALHLVKAAHMSGF